MKAITVQRLRTISQKINDLRKLEKVLTDIATQCDGGTMQNCSILETLFTNDA